MLRLPDPDHRPLRHVALPLVVAQARFSSPRPDLGRDVLERFQSSLGDAGFPLPTVIPHQIRQVFFGQTPEPLESVSHGYQLAGADGGWTVTITGDSVALETPSFESYEESFAPRLLDVVEAATSAIEPVTLSRAGLRFVNVLKKPDDAGNEGWSRWLHPTLVGVLEDPWLAPGIRALVQQLQLDLGDDVRCGVRSGPIEGDGFLLDLDNYIEPGVLWTPEVVMDGFNLLNSRGVALFQSLITPEMLGLLGGGPEREDAHHE